MHLLTNALAFVVALGAIIFVHEVGHLLIAKLFRVRVLTFSLGFGPRLWGVRRGETDYRVSAVPLGGYVRLGGENPEESTGDPRELLSHPRWQRVLVYLAGPSSNIVLAILLIAVVLMVGLEVPYLQDIPPVVGTVEGGSPAERAGLRPGDRVVEVKGSPVERWQEVALAIMESPERRLPLVVVRDGVRLPVDLTPERVPKYEFGEAGVYPRVLPRISMVVPDSPADGAGFEVGDEIRSVGRRPLANPLEFVEAIESNLGHEVEVEVRRGEQVLRLLVEPADEGGKGRIGVGLTVARRYGPVAALVESVRYNWDVTVQTFSLLGKLLRREVEARSALHGPIEIAALSGQAARQGLTSLLHLMGLVSVSIAILNLLPIPLLDGGQVAVLLLESAMRRDLSLRLKEAINLAGLAIIVVLMVAVILFDLGRNLPVSLLPGDGSP